MWSAAQETEEEYEYLIDEFEKWETAGVPALSGIPPLNLMEFQSSVERAAVPALRGLITAQTEREGTQGRSNHQSQQSKPSKPMKPQQIGKGAPKPEDVNLAGLD